MILQADKLTLQYGQKIIADKLDFKVDKSEIISIIGPNGSGKSTLLKSLGRLLKPTHGTVLLEGKDIQKMKPGRYSTQDVNIATIFNGSNGYDCL